MFHATAMVRDYDATVQRLGHLIGMRVLEYGEATDPAIGRRGGMTWIGDGSLEVCEPIVEGAHPDRFVKRTGGGMQGVALWIENFAATVAHLERHDVEMPVRLPDGFGFSSPRATCGIQLEWAEFTVDEDPRAGAPEPAFVIPPVLDVTNLAFVGAVVDTPIADARRLAELLDSKVLFEDSQAAAGEPEAGVSVGDCALALYRIDREHSRELWGRMHDRPRVSLLGVRVSDLDLARSALVAAGVGILREATGVLVLDPSATGDIELAVVDRLLPGDPRS
jgi:hypothetical protein